MFWSELFSMHACSEVKYSQRSLVLERNTFNTSVLWNENGNVDAGVFQSAKTANTSLFGRETLLQTFNTCIFWGDILSIQLWCGVKQVHFCSRMKHSQPRFVPFLFCSAATHIILVEFGGDAISFFSFFLKKKPQQHPNYFIIAVVSTHFSETCFLLQSIYLQVSINPFSTLGITITARLDAKFPR